MSTESTPFRLEVSDADIADLKQRLARTRWPEAATTPDWIQGVPLDYCRELATYWEKDYDWRATEARLNALPQFRTEIDGVNVWYAHLRSPRVDALPLLIGHGWPGTVMELLDILAPLADPQDDSKPAFHVVLPSIPGYGLSDKPTGTGWGVMKIADAWDELMTRLGYGRYMVHGGDWGSYIASAMGTEFAENVLGIHITLPMAAKPDEPVELTPREMARLGEVGAFWAVDSGYAVIQSTKPQTLGYGLTDSPVGQLAWVVEKFWAWSDHDGNVEKAIARDRMLDTVSLHWFQSAGASSGRIYWESFRKTPVSEVPVPTGVSSFPKDASTPRAWCEKRFTDLRYWNNLDHGGHFPALEHTEILIDEIRAFARTLR